MILKFPLYRCLIYVKDMKIAILLIFENGLKLKQVILILLITTLVLPKSHHVVKIANQLYFII